MTKLLGKASPCPRTAIWKAKTAQTYVVSGIVSRSSRNGSHQIYGEAMTVQICSKRAIYRAAMVPLALMSMLCAAANPQGGSTNPGSILYADQFPGSDDGARISSALAGCANVQSCVIDARNLRNLNAAETIT